MRPTIHPRPQRAAGYGGGLGAQRTAAWAAALVLLLLGSNAGAQIRSVEPVGEPVPDWYVDFDAAYRLAGQEWVERLSRGLYDETATFDVRYLPSAGAAFGAGAGRRLWRALAVGVEVTYFRASTGTRVAASVPHPLFFRRPRTWEHTPASVRFTELGIHLQVGWTFRITERIELGLAGGPSLFDVRRDRLTRIDTTEVGPPYSQVAPAGDARAAARRRVPGANAGLDLTYYFARRLEPGAYFWKAGIGGFVRWSGGTAERLEPGPERGTVERWRGGLSFRLRF